MREGKFEQPNTPKESPETPKLETPEVEKPELAEGLDKDPRVETIRTELIEDWKQTNEKDILSAEGQDFLFGDPTARKRGERPITIEQRAQKVFTERFPEDAVAYAKKEKTRVYENPADDPAIREVEENITRITNQDMTQTQKGMWGEAAAKETSGMGYGDIWDRNFNRVNMQKWDNFISLYPGKAASYREKFEPIKQAFERQERLRQNREQREREERERAKTIDDNPTRDFMDNTQTGENINTKTGTVESEKEVAWKNQQEEIERSVDSLGYKIDGQIKETVVAFNVMELPTSASCEGHVDHGMSAPWIEVSAPDQPEERFIGEKEIFQKIANKYGVNFEDVKQGTNNDAWGEALRESSKNDETPEYKQWREETKKLMDKTSALLEEFYADRDVPPSIRLGISEGGEGEFRVRNGGEDYRPVSKELTKEQKNELSQRLMQYQEEMKKFTVFLKDQYFSEKY